MGAGVPVPYPDQVPRFDIPGAEYFSLAPNAHIALGGRRRVFTVVTTTVVPASGTNSSNSSTVLEQPFTQTSGVYVHRAFIQLFPQDALAFLTIESALLCLNVSATANNALAFPLGISASTNLTPVGATVAVLERDVLATWRDIAPMTGFAPLGGAGILNATVSVTYKNNDAANPHSMQCVYGLVYTRLDGFTE